LEIVQSDLLLEYLYVGLSKATFYLGVTLSKKFYNELNFIEECFVQDGNWQLNLKNKRNEVGINDA
jgi:hypothetical protein